VAVTPFDQATAVEQAMARAWPALGVKAETFGVARRVGGYETTPADILSRRS
jgi:hypothetical protein